MEQVEGDRCRLNVTTLKALLLVFHYTDGYENVFIRAMMNFIFEPVWTNRLTMSRCLQLINVTNNRVRASRSQSVIAAGLCSFPYLFPWPLRHLCKIHALQAFSPYTYLLPFYRATFQLYSSSHTFPFYSLFLTSSRTHPAWWYEKRACKVPPPLFFSHDYFILTSQCMYSAYSFLLYRGHNSPPLWLPWSWPACWWYEYTT